MQKMLSIIIVHYRVKNLLENCLNSIFENNVNFDFEVIVVDNNSGDDSQEYLKSKFPQLIWIQNEVNFGFSKANNIGVEKANGKFVLILNPDTILPNTILQEIINFSQKQTKFGILGVRMVNEQGKFHPESKRNIPTPFNTFKKLYTTIFQKNIQPTKSYYFNELGEFEIGKVSILTGAFMLIYKEIYQKIGGFDEKYFMYGEDIDLSYSVLKDGNSNFYYGKQTIIHLKGKSTTQNLEYYFNFFNAMQIFVKKYYFRNIFIGYFLIFGLKIRYFLEVILYYFKLNSKKNRTN